ncbi:MAG: VCBS repeat-containing protein [Planctomycetes bacterium]|nr:VCBS repeat-containing protein [Planctomycetota bacterium]
MRNVPRCAASLVAWGVLASFAFAQGVSPFASSGQYVPWEISFPVPGDFDGDGRVDLIARSSVAMGVPGSFDGLVQFRNDGFGTFTVVALIPITAAPFSSQTVTDLDQDGLPEVTIQLVGNSSAQFHSFANYEATGSGGIALSFTAAGAFGTNGLITGDVNGDGRIDVVTKQSFSSSHPAALVVSLRSVAGTYPATPNVIPTIQDPDSAVLVDVGDDGIMDYVVAHGLPSGAISVDRGDGAGSSSITESVGGYSGSFAVSGVVDGDVDGDGDSDVIGVPDQLQPALYRNAPLGLLPGVKLAPGFPWSMSGGLRRPALIDLDDDGDLDLTGSSATQLGGARYLIEMPNNGTGSFTMVPPVQHQNALEMVRADVDGDGDVDLVSTQNSSSTSSPEVLWTITREAGTWAGGVDPTAAAQLFIPAAAGDFDGDGDRDIVRGAPATGNFHAFMNQGAATFASGPVVSGAGNVFSLEGADVDGDGKSDLVFLTYPNKTLNMKLATVGGFGATQSYATAATLGSPDAIGVGDIDADGDLDVVAASLPPATGITVMRNTGGAFTAIQTLPAFIDPLDLELGDVSGDGILDLVCARGTSNLGNSIAIFVGTGTGFAPPIEVGPVPFGFPDEVELGDLDGDGREDLLVVGTMTTQTLTGFAASFVFGTGWTGAWVATAPLPTLARALRCMDQDGDGRLDAVVASSFANSVAVMSGNGDGTFGEPVAISVNGDATYVDVANYDGDADLEIAAVRMNLANIAVAQPRCRGAAAKFGRGCAGDGGFVPELTVQGCFGSGSNVTFAIDDARGGGPAVLLFGLTASPQLFSTSCVLHLGGLLPSSIVLPLFGSGAGNGSLTLPATLPSIASGITFTMQAACADPTLPWGYTTTNALEVFTE